MVIPRECESFVEINSNQLLEKVISTVLSKDKIQDFANCYDIINGEEMLVRSSNMLTCVNYFFLRAEK